MKHTIAITLIFALLGSYAPISSAQEPWMSAILKAVPIPPDPKTVPSFCLAWWPDLNKSKTNWWKKFGPDFGFMNHYCDTAKRIPICWRYPKADRNACLTKLLEGPSYSIRQAKNPNYQLLPFLYTELGKMLKDLGRYIEAIEAFQNAIKKNQRYIPAYVKLSDTYLLIKDVDSAEATVRQGLKFKKHKALLRRLKKIEASRK